MDDNLAADAEPMNERSAPLPGRPAGISLSRRPTAALAAVWTLRIGWLTVPVLSAPMIAEAWETAASDGMSGWPATAAVPLWIGWAATLTASFVRRPWALSWVRIVVPTGALCALVAASVLIADSGDAVSQAAGRLAAVGVVCAAAAAALVPDYGNDAADGLSYGNERRLLLRPPTVLLRGPILVVWAVAVGGLAAPLALFASVASGPADGGQTADAAQIADSEQTADTAQAADGRQTADTAQGSGAVLTAAEIGRRLGRRLAWAGATVPLLATGVLAVRALHQLSRRWIVFVPNGLVVADRLTVREPVLLRRAHVARLGPAFVGIDLDDPGLIDLTAGARGPVLAVELHTEAEIVVRPADRRAAAQTRSAHTVLLSPNRPGAVLDEAARRRFSVR